MRVRLVFACSLGVLVLSCASPRPAARASRVEEAAVGRACRDVPAEERVPGLDGLEVVRVVVLRRPAGTDTFFFRHTPRETAEGVAFSIRSPAASFASLEASIRCRWTLSRKSGARGDPLAVPGTRLRAYRDVGDTLRVQLATPDPSTACEVVRRARAMFQRVEDEAAWREGYALDSSPDACAPETTDTGNERH